MAGSSLLCLALLAKEPLARAADVIPPAVVTKAPPAIIAKAPPPPRWILSVEGGYLFDSSANNLTFDPADPYLSFLGPLRPSNGGEFGVTIGRRIDPAWDVTFGYHVNSLAASHEGVAAALPVGGLVLSQALTASASNSLTYQTFDAEIGYRPPAWQAYDVRLFVGPRVLIARSGLNYAFNDLSTSPFGAFNKLGTFDQDIDIAGFGPRAGFDASVPLAFASAPVTFDLSGSGSVLFSEATDHYSFAYTFQNFPITTSGSGSPTIKTSPTIYNLEAKAGFDYHFNAATAFEIGYQVQQWYGLAQDVYLANDIGGFQAGQSNVLVHGPFAKLTVALP